MYIFFSFIILIFSFFLFKRAAGTLSLSKPNMISYIFYYNILLQVFIGSILVMSLSDVHYMINRIDSDVRFYGWLAIMYTMIALPLGMLLANLTFYRKKKNRFLINYYSYKPINTSGVYGRSLKYSTWVFTAFAILSCSYVFWVIGYHPFIKVFTTSYSEIESLRITAARHFSGNVYVKNIFALTLMPIMTYVWFFYYLKSRSAFDLIFALICLFFCLSILYYDFSKSPILWYVLSFVFVYYYSLGRINLSKVLVFSILALVLLFLMYSFAGLSLSDFFYYNSGPIGRVIFGQASGLYFMLDIYPDFHEHIGFSSLSQFISESFGTNYTERAARTAMEKFNPDGVEEGVAGVMNSLFIGEAWANFGIWGVIISPFWVGMLVQALYLFFLRSAKSPLHLAFFVNFSISGAITGGVNDYIYNPSFFVVFSLFILILGFSYILSYLHESRSR